MMPDYVTITYDFIIWTSYIEQMNKIVEKIVYSDGAYWGDPDSMRFRSSIDSFEDATEIGDSERLVRTNFTVTLRGYLLPKGNFDHRSTTQKFVTPQKVIFGTETVDNITKNIGKSGQFQEELPEDTTIGSSPSVGDLGISTTNPIVFNAGTGVTLSENGVEFNGAQRVDQTISIGQDVSSTANVVFNSVSASSLTLGSTIFKESQITGSISISGGLTTSTNVIVDGNANVNGTLTVRELHTEFVSASIVFASGSTQFGDTLDDTHQFSGSISVSGSLNLNNYSITEISNDSNLTDSSATALVTENAVKNYVNTNVIQSNSYLRKQFFKTSNSITVPSTASFSAISASAPTGLTSTSKNDFVFFINGQYMEHDALDIQQVGSTFHLIVNNDSIGYDLETDDEILAIGKFNS